MKEKEKVQWKQKHGTFHSRGSTMGFELLIWAHLGFFLFFFLFFFFLNVFLGVTTSGKFTTCASLKLVNLHAKLFKVV